MQAFGEAISSGKKVEIDFEAGRLTVNERKWTFSFKSEIYGREGTLVEYYFRCSIYSPHQEHSPLQIQVSLSLRMPRTLPLLTRLPTSSRFPLPIHLRLSSKLSALATPRETHPLAVPSLRSLILKTTLALSSLNRMPPERAWEARARPTWAT